jgi:hypothetical protein
VRQHGWHVLGDAFVKKGARTGIAAHLRQRLFTVEKWPTAQVLAVMLDQVEGIELWGSLATAELFEPGQTVRPYPDRLAVDREAFGLDRRRSGSNRRQSLRSVVCLAAIERTAAHSRRTNIR